MLVNGGWDLTLILLTWTIWRAPTDASKWRMGFNSAFKGLLDPHVYVQIALIKGYSGRGAPIPGARSPKQLIFLYSNICDS